MYDIKLLLFIGWLAVLLTAVTSCNTAAPGNAPEGMILIQGGPYLFEATAYEDNQTGYTIAPVKIILSPFYMGIYEVTLDDFQLFLDDTGYQSRYMVGRGGIIPPNDDIYVDPDAMVINAFVPKKNYSDDFSRIASYPAACVSWDDAISYCNWRSRKENLEPVYEIRETGIIEDELSIDASLWEVTANWDANGYRLPTEAEWQYAASGGRKSRNLVYSGSNDIDDVAHYMYNSGWGTHKVGEKMPNELGLYDLSGNLWEWCWDKYAPGYTPEANARDPKGPDPDFPYSRILRGGAWNEEADYCRVDSRSSSFPLYCHGYHGFRLCRSADPTRRTR